MADEKRKSVKLKEPEGDLELGNHEHDEHGRPNAKSFHSVRSLSTIASASEKKRCCEFPIDLSDYCLPFVPSSFKVIQDMTHVIIIMGVIASTIALLWSLIGLLTIIPIFPGSSNGGCFIAARMWCSVHGMSLIALFGAGFYLWKLCGEYDQQLLKKRQELKQSQHLTSEAYSATARDMEKALEKQQASNAGLAEKSFEGRRRDFIKFLKKTKEKLAHAVLTVEDSRHMLQEFRKFVRQWFQIFEEASLDPLKKPLEAELDEMDIIPSVDMICDFVIETLNGMEVKFISDEVDGYQQDAEKAQVEAAAIKRKNADGELAAYVLGGHQLDVGGQLALRFYFVQWKKATDFSKAEKMKAATDAKANGGATGGARSMPLMSDKDHDFNFAAEDDKEDNRGGCVTVSWITCGPTPPYIDEDTVDHGFPRNIWCVCCTLTVLSRDHLGLMWGIVFGSIAAALCLLPIWADSDGDTAGVPMFRMLFILVLSIVSIVFVLIVFEDVDQVMQLQREVTALKDKTKKLKEKHKKMKDFWEDVQNLTDLWLHRSIPRLEVMKEAQGHIEDAPAEQLGKMLMLTNETMSKLEVSVGDRALWKSGGAIKDEDKKAFGQKVMALSDGADLDTVIRGLNNVGLMIADRTRQASSDAVGMFQETPGSDKRRHSHSDKRRHSHSDKKRHSHHHHHSQRRDSNESVRSAVSVVDDK